jgi:hypothetical protein
VGRVDSTTSDGLSGRLESVLLGVVSQVRAAQLRNLGRRLRSARSEEVARAVALVLEHLEVAPAAVLALLLGRRHIVNVHVTAVHREPARESAGNGGQEGGGLAEKVKLTSRSGVLPSPLSWYEMSSPRPSGLEAAHNLAPNRCALALHREACHSKLEVVDMQVKLGGRGRAARMPPHCPLSVDASPPAPSATVFQDCGTGRCLGKIVPTRVALTGAKHPAPS